MPYFRQHVEDMMVSRLSRALPDDLPEEAVSRMLARLESPIRVAMEKVLWRTDVPGVTEDDLVCYMGMKAHQLLRQRRYDESRNPHSFFYAAFCNLSIDIARASKRKHVEAMERDLLDYVVDRHFDESFFTDVGVV